MEKEHEKVEDGMIKFLCIVSILIGAFLIDTSDMILFPICLVLIPVAHLMIKYLDKP